MRFLRVGGDASYCNVHLEILEIAIGTGLNCPLYSKTCNLTGIDLSEGMLEVAKRRTTDLELLVNLSIMGGEQLCFPDDSFDTVVETMTMCTFPDPVKALQEMARVCREDGRIFLLEHGRSHTGWIARYQDRHAQQYAKSLGCCWNLDHNAIIQDAGLPIIAAERKLLGVFYLIESAPS